LNCPEDCMPMLAAPSARIRVSIFDQFPGLSEEESLVAYTVDKKVETHGEQEARAVDESSLKNGSVSLRFFVMTRARSGSSAQSGSAGGGAVVLEELVYQLRENGHEASLLHADSVEAFWFVPQRAPHHVRCGGNHDMKHAVIIYPEVLPLLCKDALIHVRWVLAPMGVHAEKDTTTHWGQDDMVFHFNGFGGPFYHHVGKISAISVPPSNALQVLRDPCVGDGFDITKYPPLPRNGTAYTVRKGKLLHGNHLPGMHAPGDTLIDKMGVESLVQALRTHEYFVSYDPATFLSHIAAMLGCVSILAPVPHESKSRYWSKSALGPYLAESNLEAPPGIAYGSGLDEIERARATMHLSRESLLAFKHWGQTVAVERMVRDVGQYATGARSGFEGALLVREVYPDRWWRRNDDDLPEPADASDKDVRADADTVAGMSFTNFMEGVLLIFSTGFIPGSIYGSTLFSISVCCSCLYVPVWARYNHGPVV